MIDTVIKVGGALLGDRARFARVVDALGGLPPDGRTLIVPGGGPFADAVRDVARRHPVGDDAAHWAAVLAMDQYAHVLGALVPCATVVDYVPGDGPDVTRAVLAPFRWLREADPLPHSWDVTSDSIAAWIARAVGARRLVLLKSVGQGDRLVDPYFGRAVPAGVQVLILDAATLARDALAEHLTSW